jgi:methionyl-tRNA synthetase
MPELMENPACQVCGELLKPKERGNSENLAYSKDKTRSYYICNKCRKKLLQMHEQAKFFMDRDIFFASVRV